MLYGLFLEQPVQCRFAAIFRRSAVESEKKLLLFLRADQVQLAHKPFRVRCNCFCKSDEPLCKPFNCLGFKQFRAVFKPASVRRIHFRIQRNLQQQIKLGNSGRHLYRME
ncbi:hypothetical protein D1872_201940 [compost metagenome]